MKAILMAAGMGTRIATKTNEPKCLLDIGNGPLIRHTVELLLNNHMEVCICLGFKGYLIREALRDYPITFYENPFYRVTNSIASLWFSREQLDEHRIFCLRMRMFSGSRIFLTFCLRISVESFYWQTAPAD